MTMYKVLLVLHIAAGALSLMAAAGALAAPKGGRWHALAGRGFVVGMALVFFTALPMTLIRPNLFLLLIAIFSAYLALSGWLRARNRSGTPWEVEWIAAIVMALAAVAMAGRGLVMLASGASMGIVLVVFGAIGGVLAVRDLQSLRAKRYRGQVRIAAHLARMLGGTIATVTAFAVVNVRIEPAFVVWLAPTVLFVPVIVYWSRRVKRPCAAAPAAPWAASAPAWRD
jgi:hypothetical protein